MYLSSTIIVLKGLDLEPQHCLKQIWLLLFDEETESQMNAGAVQAAVIPSIHWAPASPLKLPLLNKMILYTAGQIFDSLVVYSIVPTVTHQSDIAQKVPGNIAENLVKQFRDKQCPRVDEFFLFHTFWSDLKDRDIASILLETNKKPLGNLCTAWDYKKNCLLLQI